MAYISEIMSASRVIKKGKVEALPFRMKGAAIPFSIIVIPKTSITNGVISLPENEGILVNCRLLEDTNTSLYPIMFLRETSASIVELTEGSINLDVYDVYWGAGGPAEVEQVEV